MAPLLLIVWMCNEQPKKTNNETKRQTNQRLLQNAVQTICQTLADESIFES